MNPGILGAIATIQDTEYVPTNPYVELLFDNIENTPLAGLPHGGDDVTEVGNWNNFFFTMGIPIPPITYFTKVTIIGNKVILEGGTNLLLEKAKFKANHHILNFIDTGCFVEMQSDPLLGSFKGSDNLSKVKLPTINSTNGECFKDDTALTEIDIRGCNELGANAFTNIIGQTISITIKESLQFDSQIETLQTDNTVTLVII